MWTILKFNKRELNILKEGFKQKLGDNFQIYIPKLKIQKFKNNKLVSKDYNLLDDYMFFFHKKLNLVETINSIKFIRGLKYFLKDFHPSQDEIENFIKKCKNLENKEGYLSKDFFEINIKKKYKFVSGPFTNKIFKIIDLNKNRINILMGNVKTTLKKKEFLFTPI